MKPDLTARDREAVDAALRDSHRRAMEAKEHVFVAQDAIGAVWQHGVAEVPMTHWSPKLVAKLEKQLQRARGALEAYDRLLRSCKHSPLDGPLGSRPKAEGDS